jgi:hypothetical protein
MIETMMNAQANGDQKRTGRAFPPMTKARVSPGFRPVRAASTNVDGGTERRGYSQGVEFPQALNRARSAVSAFERRKIAAWPQCSADI